MAEVSTRYVTARDTLAQRRKDYDAASKNIVSSFGRDDPNRQAAAESRRKQTDARGAMMQAESAFNTVKPEYDQWNDQLARASQQTIANTGIVNQRAAMVDAGSRQEAAMSAPPAAALEGADGTPEARGEFDTETPGGTSGRRRRNAIAVGSIRI